VDGRIPAIEKVVMASIDPAKGIIEALAAGTS